VRYFYYTNENNAESTVIIIDDNSALIDLYPKRMSFSSHKRDWLDHYKSQKANNRTNLMFEICESQFLKFFRNGTKPDNWDW